METIVESSHDNEFPKKSRSLDLKSLYESGVSKGVLNRNLKRKVGPENGDDQRIEKRVRKKVSLSSFRNVHSKSRRSLGEVYDGGLHSDGQDMKDPKLELSGKHNISSGLKKVPLILDDNVVQIPKRKRGLIGRKKLVTDQLLKPVEQSGCKIGLVNDVAKLSGDCSCLLIDSWKIKQKKIIDDLKENIENELNSTCHLKEEDGHTDKLVENNGDLLSLKKPRRKARKRKDLTQGNGNISVEVAASVGNSSKKCGGSREDDEKNLEENAARMLSSRFDPSCTGFSLSSKASALTPENGPSFLSTTGHNIVSRDSRSLSGSESESADTAARVLRPRKQRKEKGGSRKRRHFYEVFFRDLDAYWVLNRRIKIFWPLDQSWYYGLVNDYDEERKLHHVKYDDRDEEWVNLLDERFKLLMLPTEVPGKAVRKKSSGRNKISDSSTGRSKTRKEKKRSDPTIRDDDCTGSYMDSEPIISWLARSTHRVKSSSSHALKKQKTSGRSLKSVPLLLSGKAKNVGVDDSSLGRDKIVLSNKSEFSDIFGAAERLKKSASESTSCSKERIPIVYFRRKFRKTGVEILHMVKSDCGSRSAHGFVASFSPAVDDSDDIEEHDIFLGRLDPARPLRSTDDGLFLTLPVMETGDFRFVLSLPMYPFLSGSLKAENKWLSYALMLLEYGVLMSIWPKVHLEMLFVDNIVGLRLLSFEGYLKQAVALVFLVLTTFHTPENQVKYVDFQLPVTSIKFRFSCSQDIKKQLVFALYNFAETTSSKWFHLDRRLEKHCLLTKQLPLAECTYDNIKALHKGTNQLLVPTASILPSFVKAIPRKPRQGVSVMGVHSEAAFVNISPSPSCDDMCKSFPSFALSFKAAPTFFVSLHLKLIMEHCVAHIRFQDPESAVYPEKSGSLMVNDSPGFCECSEKGSAITLEHSLKNSRECGKSSQNFHHDKKKRVPSPGSSRDTEKDGSDVLEKLQHWKDHHTESNQCPLEPIDLVDKERSDASANSFSNNLTVEVPPVDEFDKPVDGELHSVQQSVDWSWNMNGGVILSPNPTAPRSTWHRNKNGSSSSGFLSHGWSDGRVDFFNNGFGNGPKKPRTQFSYSLPFGGLEYSSRNRSHHQKGLPNKRIRRATEKRSSDISRGPPRNLESLSCDVNVLITVGDRGWRECGARVVLELFDHNEWKLAVKLSGTTKYSYKAHQFLQPGSTNRYTHAMMWKGGKDWTLEFPDRSQWALFKEMHEECYNRNVRAASVKNIPIPGVRWIEENDESVTEVSFVRASSKYFRQVETDVEMALDPSRVLYDMDSDDERWIMSYKITSEVGSSISEVISDDVFEKTMDMLEKAAYTQQRDQFTSDEIEKLMAGVDVSDLIKIIYEYWQQKRQRKGMPLIRHLQPPLWEMYQQQLREWELGKAKNHTALPNGCQEKNSSVEKPPMFAFCMKPRGLEVSNKGSKQRSYKKFSVSGHNSAISGDPDSLHGLGRRWNGYAFGDDRIAYPGYNHELLDDFLLVQTSPSVFSARDAGSLGYVSMGYDGFDRNLPSRLQRNGPKKYGTYPFPNDLQMVTGYNHRMTRKTNGINQWNMGFSKLPSQRHYQPEVLQRHIIDQLDGSDLDEFRLRDASSAAMHAHKMAKLKREKAHRLLFRADTAIHKAVAALMTAEAIKASSSEDSTGDG